MLALSTTENKIAIRRLWDKPIITEFSRSLNRGLNYFGLPGPDIYDFIDWGEYLDWKTGVQYLDKKARSNKLSEQKRKINELQTNIMLNGFSDKWELRQGKLEDIIITGSDSDGNRPKFLKLDRNGRFHLQYDLHNWDFQSGIGYNTKTDGMIKEHMRIEAIKKCISLQKGFPFLFLLTINVRHTLGDDLEINLLGKGRDLISDQYNDVLSWYAQRNGQDGTEHYRLKAFVPLLLRDFGHMNSFDCYCYPPLYYEGWKEHLLHFVTLMIPRKVAVPIFSDQTVKEVLDLPLLEVKNGKIDVAKIQHPNFHGIDIENVLQAHKLVSL